MSNTGTILNYIFITLIILIIVYIEIGSHLRVQIKVLCASEFDMKHLKKTEGRIGRNVNITMNILNDKNYQTSSR